jgi:hypothetical protein
MKPAYKNLKVPSENLATAFLMCVLYFIKHFSLILHCSLSQVCNKTTDGFVPEDSPSWCHAPFDPEGILG